MSIRDLLTHRLGFTNDPRDLAYVVLGRLDGCSSSSRSSSVTPFSRRDMFSYDNLGYLLTTYAIEHAAKEPWLNVLTQARASRRCR